MKASIQAGWPRGIPSRNGKRINGVAFDELFEMDSLSLQEIGQALSDHKGAFEFIGFDACLMATLETAQTLALFARYMIASEELEPGSGWDYLGMGQYLAQNPQADGVALGVVIADGFLASNARSGEEAMTTLSVVDLGRIGALTASLDQAGWRMFDAMTQGGSQLSDVVRGIHQAVKYGANTPEEGYTNMVDIGSMMAGIQGTVPEAGAALEALEEAAVYKVAGSARQDATGLAMYYPLKVQGSQEYQIFRQNAQSEGYRHFVAGMMYGASQGFTADEQTQLVIRETCLDEEGTYTLALDPAGAPYLLGAAFTLLMDQGDGVFYSLGEDDELAYDEENALVQDLFAGVSGPPYPTASCCPSACSTSRTRTTCIPRLSASTAARPTCASSTAGRRKPSRSSAAGTASPRAAPPPAK